MKRNILLPMFAALAAINAAGAAFAGSITAGGFTYAHATIVGYARGKITAQVNGSTNQYALRGITAMKIGGSPSFDKAEKQAAAKHWSAAVRDYRAAVHHINNRKLRDVARVRGIWAAGKANAWLAAVKFFVPLYAHHHDGATLRLWPRDYPPTASKDLRRGAALLNAAIGDSANQSPAAQKALKSLLLHVYVRSHDKRATALASQLGAHVAISSNSTVRAAAPTPTATRRILRRAKRAMAKKDYAAVLSATAPALAGAKSFAAASLYYLRGQALVGQKHYTAASLAFLRVAFNFPQSAHAPVAMYRAAMLLKNKLRNPTGAKFVAGQLAAQYPKSKAAAQAKAAGL